MARFTLKKKLAAAGVVAASMAGGFGAYAYWSTTGEGSGNATAKQSNGTLVLHAAFDSDALAPGLDTPVTYTADNAGATDLRLKNFTATVATSDVNCLATDFVIDSTVPDQTVLHGADGASIGSGTLTFKNDPDNSQDACKGATITLNLTSDDGSSS